MLTNNRLPVFGFASFLLVLLSSMALAAAAGPIFSGNVTYQGQTSTLPNGTLLTGGNMTVVYGTGNISFQVLISDNAPATAINVTNVTFQLTRPNGITQNFSSTNTSGGFGIGLQTTPAVENGSSTIFFVNFTQSMFGQAGAYTFSWYAENRSAAGVTGNFTANMTMWINKTTQAVTLSLNSSSRNLVAEKGSNVNLTATTNASDNLFNFMQISTNFTGVNASLFGNTSSTNALYNITSTSILSLGNYTFFANVSESQNFSSVVNSSAPIYIILEDTTPPTISSVGVSPAATTGGNPVSITVSDSDVDSIISTIISVTDPGNTKTTSSNVTSFSYTTTSIGGTYTISVTATDATGNSASSSSSFTISFAGSGGSSSSGGSSGSSTASSQTETKNIIIGSQPATVVMNNAGTHGVVEIDVSTNTPASGVQLSVQNLGSTKPASVTQDVSGTVYRYLSIGATNLDDTNVKTATITFNIDNSWLTQNSIDPGTVALNRLHNGIWTSLTTRLLYSNGTTSTFQATTPGFSTYAITGSQAAASTGTTPSAASNETTPSGTTTSSGAGTTETQPVYNVGGLSGNTLYIVIAAIIIIIGAAIAATKMGKKGKKK